MVHAGSLARHSVQQTPPGLAAAGNDGQVARALAPAHRPDPHRGGVSRHGVPAPFTPRALTIEWSTVRRSGAVETDRQGFAVQHLFLVVDTGERGAVTDRQLDSQRLRSDVGAMRVDRFAQRA